MAKRVPDFLSMLWSVAVALLACAVFAGACARKQTVASKSAAAYDEAVAKGLPIGSGHGGHGQGAVASHSGEEPPGAGEDPMSGMNHADHSASAGGHDHATGTEPSKAAGHEHATGMEPSKMAGHDAGSMSAMDHSRMPGHEPKTTASAGHDHSAGTEPTQESAPDLAEAPDAKVERVLLEELDPETTLRQDGLDAPAPSSVSEARRAGGGAHADQVGAEGGPADPRPAAPPGHDHHPAPPAPEGKR